jgi:hypothetical protein
MRASTSIMLFTSLVVPSLAFAQFSGCDAKRQSIESEIAYAQSHGNASRVRGLQTALAEVTAHCTDASLQSAANKKVVKARDEVAERSPASQGPGQERGKDRGPPAQARRRACRARAGVDQRGEVARSI